MSCLITGDSIALGLGSVFAECKIVAKVGRTPSQILAVLPKACYEMAVLSAGTNPKGSGSQREDTKRLADLEAIRAKVCAKRVVWVLPMPSTPRAQVASVAVR